MINDISKLNDLKISLYYIDTTVLPLSEWPILLKQYTH